VKLILAVNPRKSVCLAIAIDQQLAWGRSLAAAAQYAARFRIIDISRQRPAPVALTASSCSMLLIPSKRRDWTTPPCKRMDFKSTV